MRKLIIPFLMMVIIAVTGCDSCTNNGNSTPPEPDPTDTLQDTTKDTFVDDPDTIIVNE